MNGILLAAGTGSRLKHRTEKLPKALVELHGKPLLAYAIDFMRKLHFGRIVVVGGFEFEKVKDYLNAYGDVEIVRNPQYEKGNLYTLLAAKEHLTSGFTLLNVDHVYPDQMLSRVVSVANEITALCDFDRRLLDDDMKVKVDSSMRITQISKKLQEFDGGYIGCTVVPESRVTLYLDAAMKVVEQFGDHAVVENVLQILADIGQGPRISNTSGIRWLEIDNEEDYQKADASYLEVIKGPMAR